MKNMIKVILGLLASISLISSAYAGELSVTGTAKATYSIISGGSSDGSNTGKGLGVANEIDFGASGELENGWTWNYQVQFDPGTATGSPGYEVQNDDSQLTLTMGNFGTVGFFVSEGGLNVDDSASASVYGRATDLGITDGIKEGQGIDGANNIQYHTPAGLLPFGTTVKLAYAPSKGDGVSSANSNAGAYSLYGNRIHQYQITTKPVENLTIFADYYRESDAGSAAAVVVQENESGSIAASYVIDRFKLGLSRTLNAPLILGGASGTAAATATAITNSSASGITDATGGNAAGARLYKTNKYSIAYNATENLSLSYELEKSNRELITNAAEYDLKASAIQAAYTMGGMTIAISHAQVDNASYKNNNDSTETLLGVTMAF